MYSNKNSGSTMTDKHLLLTVLLCLVVKARGMRFSLTISFNDKVADNANPTISCNLFECAAKCLQSEDCRKLSFLRQQCHCVLYSKEELSFSRKEGWRTWIKHPEMKSVVESLTSGSQNPIDYNMTLHQACKDGKLDIVDYILQHRLADINVRQGQKARTPVMLAARYGHLNVVKFLYTKDCNVSEVDNHNNSILHLACIGGHVDIVEYIVSENMVDIERKGSKDRTPVMVAAASGKLNVVKFLITKGCNLSEVDIRGSTILHIACARGHVDLVKFILSLNTSDTESKGISGMTPLMWSVAKEQRHVFDILMSKGCKLNVLDDNGNNILHVACTNKNIDMVKHLLTLKGVKGMEKVKYKAGQTPLQVAKGNAIMSDLLKGKK